MNRKQTKRLVKELAASNQVPRIVELAAEEKRVVGVLCSLLFEQDARLRWRVIEALGAVAAAVAVTDSKSVRDLLRRLEWLMNDESGGAGWHSPEAIAAIVLSVPVLIDDFGLLLGSYLNDARLGRGAHWAVAAIAKVRPDLFADKVDELTASLKSADPYVRGYSVVGLAALTGETVADKIRPLIDDAGTLDLYSRATGELHPTTVGDLAKLVAAQPEGTRTSLEVW